MPEMWPKNFIASDLVFSKPNLTWEMMYLHHSEAPSSCVKRGDSGGCSSYWNKLLRATMVDVCTPGVLEMVIAMPFLKGPISDNSTARMTCERALL